jgi:hypothetical protein
MKPTDNKQVQLGFSLQQPTVPNLTRSQERDSETIAVHGPNGDRSVRAEKNAAGEIDWEVKGKRPQRDDDELPVASALVQRLNSEGAEWDQPIKVEGEFYDCECLHLRDRKKILWIQVTRIGTEIFRKQWGDQGAMHEDGADVEGLADVIMAAIQLKVSKQADWSNVALALDATSAPQHALTAVVQMFRKKHGDSSALAEFMEIWLIGPDSATTHCLAQQRTAIGPGEDGE